MNAELNNWYIVWKVILVLLLLRIVVLRYSGKTESSKNGLRHKFDNENKTKLKQTEHEHLNKDHRRVVVLILLQRR